MVINKLYKKYWSAAYMFGIIIPNNVDEEIIIDSENGIIL